jgi:CubicO group peptidase (beta-lactamase class C family)
MDPARVGRVRELAAGWVKSGITPSLCVLAARHGTIVLHEAFGVRRQDDTAATLKRDSIFTISSCSKPITAALVMCLVEDGLIGLNRPFVEYMPELDVPGVQWLEEARVADLLCHTSGLEDVQVGAFIAEAARRSPELPPPAPGQHPALGRRIQLAAGVPLARRPGSAMLYSNTGYNWLADIVRRVSGQPFWQFAQQRLFEPLGMRDTHYWLPPELRDRRVYRTPAMPGIPPVPGLHGGVDSPEYDELDLGSMGVTSTAGDLAIFLQMLLNRGVYNGKRILTSASIAAMTRAQADDNIPHLTITLNPTTGQRQETERKEGGYGYGLYIFGPGDAFAGNGSLMSTQAFGHAGFGGAFFWADPVHDTVGVYLSVTPRLVRGSPVTKSDQFQNAVHAAIVE